MNVQLLSELLLEYLRVQQELGLVERENPEGDGRGSGGDGGNRVGELVGRLMGLPETAFLTALEAVFGPPGNPMNRQRIDAAPREEGSV